MDRDNLFSYVRYDDAVKEILAIEIGSGDVTIFDIDKDSFNRAGIAFKLNPGLHVGDDAGMGGMRLDNVEPDLIIITDNIESLKVLQDKVERAIRHLEKVS